jgi:hypothetical protein
MEIERERWHYLEKSKHLQVTNITVAKSVSDPFPDPH